jgi:hypothetical protein
VGRVPFEKRLAASSEDVSAVPRQGGDDDGVVATGSRLLPRGFHGDDVELRGDVAAPSIGSRCHDVGLVGDRERDVATLGGEHVPQLGISVYTVKAGGRQAVLTCLGPSDPQGQQQVCGRQLTAALAVTETYMLQAANAI